MTAYHVRPWEVPAIEAGRTWSTLRPGRRAPSRHALAGEELSLFAGQRLIAQPRCILRAPVLVDAEGVRTIIPVDIFDHDPHAEALQGVWTRGYAHGAARICGYPGWSYLAWRLEHRLGPPPWALELIAWRPLRVALTDLSRAA